MKYRSKAECDMTISQFHAAALLGVALNDLRELIDEGLHVVKGTSDRFYLMDIERLIERREQRSRIEADRAEFA